LALVQGCHRTIAHLRRNLSKKLISRFFGFEAEERLHAHRVVAELAIVVVGVMITTLFLTRCLMPVLYSFYGHREPRQEAGRMAH
jgi:hypothetical protein